MRSLSSAFALAAVWTIKGAAALGGLGGTTTSDVCTQTIAELQDLLVNQDQEQDGVEGNVLVTNDCKELVEANVMNLHSDKEQKSLCGNSCYSNINAKYKILLDNDCFASDDVDEEASAKLQAAAYQLACQTNSDGKYCIPLLGALVDEAGTTFDICSDIVSKLGCCFQSYRQYMLLGTAASVTAMDDTQKECTNDGIGGLDLMCSCAYNQHAFANTTFCSHAYPGIESTAKIVAIILVLLVTAAIV